jgi:hypothetical protein
VKTLKSRRADKSATLNTKITARAQIFAPPLFLLYVFGALLEFGRRSGGNGGSMAICDCRVEYDRPEFRRSR